MQLRPIIASLRHHKLTVLLLILQVAFTGAIVCNAAFMIAQRLKRISVPTGIAETELSVIRSAGIEKGANIQAQHAADLDALRKIPGVRSAVAIGWALPLSQSDSSYGTCPSKSALDRAMRMMSIDGSGCLQPSVYNGTPGLVETLGLRMVEGRDFRTDDYVNGFEAKPAVAIISRALAQHLYPRQEALGQNMYVGDSVVRVVGIVDTLLRPALRKPGVDGDSMIWPQQPDGLSVSYVMRSDPRDRQRVLAAAAATLMQVNPNRLLDPKQMQSFVQIRDAYFKRDITMIGLLIASGLGLLFVTALGIAGLANFWVQQRTRQIGIRRAIGATRGDILRYFQIENFIIVSAGVAVGLALACGLNMVLMTQYELPRLPFCYLPISAVMMWLLGQFAVLNPALRAAAVPPVVATRSV